MPERAPVRHTNTTGVARSMVSASSESFCISMWVAPAIRPASHS